MRWYKNQNYGALRVVSKFLFFPKQIGGETRWWEYATWEEKWVKGGGPGACPDFWRKTRWIDANS